ncbi:MAG: class I SAM-dependent rRNA methyltransferase [Proteobacteria bacterium]|nr:class I SAM-dependent rRNA methyltransferase [Pseudomonadota bacterium]
MSNPKLHIKHRSELRITHGSLWIFSNEIENFAELKNLEKGTIVDVEIKRGETFALAYFNSHSLIAARILTRDAEQKIDADFFVEKISAAKNLRDKFFDKPFYRLIHSEADFLPGLVIDRFDNVLSCQISTAGMEKLTQFLIAALEKLFPDAAIIFRNDVEARKFEALELYIKNTKGEVADEILIEENNLKFLANIKSGQKTGWFFDQRINRDFISSLSKDCDVLDAFCYNGGFGLNALKNNAKSVTFIDSSQSALDQLSKNIVLNNFTQECEIICDKVVEVLDNPEFQKRRFDIVVLDPPAFVKSKKDFAVGLKAYEKLVRLSAKLLRKNGILMLASCSHNASLSDLIAAANDGLRKADRKARLIRTFGAGFDHPVNPALKESEYLKSITFLVE